MHFILKLKMFNNFVQKVTVRNILVTKILTCPKYIIFIKTNLSKDSIKFYNSN